MVQCTKIPGGSGEYGSFTAVIEDSTKIRTNRSALEGLSVNGAVGSPSVVDPGVVVANRPVHPT